MADLTPEAIAELRRLNEERIKFQDWLSARSTSKRAGWVNAAAEQWMNAVTEKFPALLDAAERCAAAEAQAKAAGELWACLSNQVRCGEIQPTARLRLFMDKFAEAFAAAERAGVKP